MVVEHGGGLGEPEEPTWTRGADYVRSWREADAAAAEVNAVAASLGIDPELVRAVPHSMPHCEPVVWIRPLGARALARVLAHMAGRLDGDGHDPLDSVREADEKEE